jgi:membrane protein implicated in regulation of membrane protease activity
MFEKRLKKSSPRTQRFQGDALVEQTIYPRQRGRVYFRGSWWYARCEDNILIEVGEFVTVIGREELTLIVVPIA